MVLKIPFKNLITTDIFHKIELLLKKNLAPWLNLENNDPYSKIKLSFFRYFAF